MYINLYSTSDDPRTANKQLSTIASNIPCKPAEPCSLIAPQILLDYSSTYLAANYVYLSDFDCFYFAVPTLETGREMRLVCKLDPLMSFTLDDVEIMCIRSESAGVNFVPDDKLPIDPSRCFVEGILFPSQPLSGGSMGLDYLLTVNGGNYGV